MGKKKSGKKKLKIAEGDSSKLGSSQKKVSHKKGTSKSIKKKIKIVEEVSLKHEFEKIKDFPNDSKEYQSFLRKKEQEDTRKLETHSDFEYLYPNIDDPNFNIKIAERKEFNDTQYDGSIKIAHEEAEKLCNAEFELAPHQQFVKNFLSFNTPYNSLLLYHGLGTGKTCSAISISEEMREYLKQIGLLHRIIIVASPNVQENFKLQLFDERKLKLVDGLWTIRACTGNTYLKEINPMNMKGITREKVINQVKHIINSSYLFMGYTEFGNYVEKSSNVPEDMDSKSKESLKIRKLKRAFNNRLIIIDEVHNIRITDDNKDKRVARNLMNLVMNVDNLRLLLLSATPMYNSYKEIIWLLNLMNTNDKRSTININEVFDKDGSFKQNEKGEEIGKNMLIQKATGYVSFIRGNNPYTFPYTIYPRDFSPEHSILNTEEYPRLNLNGKNIIQGLEHLDIYGIEIGNYQNMGYKYLLDNLKNTDRKIMIKGKEIQMPSFENMEGFGYTLLTNLIQALNIVYPFELLESETEPEFDPSELIGIKGLNRIMTYTETTQPPARFDYAYRETKYGKIFTEPEIGKYSSKIETICKNVQGSTGITLIYSQLLPGGLIPIALALEEMGYKRYGNAKSLLKDPSTKIPNPPKYVMITGDKMFSPNNIEEVKACTSEDNINGEQVKVILISMAGSEGLDFKNIRQVHILEPWYNTNRVEQIVGRAVRTCSHKLLQFDKRNVMVFLYGIVLPDNSESVDLYIYRLAELKAVQIGRVSRVLKGAAVDCILNHEQVNFTEAKMKQRVNLSLSNNKIIEYNIGDKPYSAMCDYMDTCEFECTPCKKKESLVINEDTYESNFIIMNNEKIIQRIKNLFKEHYFFKKIDLIKEIVAVKEYPKEQIYSALDKMINDKNEFITDRYGRNGRLINIGDYYMYQPSEINNERVSIFERTRPLDYKRESLKITLELPSELHTEGAKKPHNKNIKLNTLLEKIKNNYDVATTSHKIMRGEKDWYKFSNLIIQRMEDEEGISRDIMIGFLIAHLVEECLYDEVQLLLNHIYFPEKPLNDFEIKIKDYFDSNIIIDAKLIAFLTQENGKHKLLIKGKSMWEKEKPEDYKDLASEITERFNSVIKNLSPVIGFIINFKKTFMVFKTKHTALASSKGARCDQASKPDIIKTLNSIVGETKFSKDNTKLNTLIELCCYQEFMLRYYNSTKKNDKVWFLDPGIAALVKSVVKI